MINYKAVCNKCNSTLIESDRPEDLLSLFVDCYGNVTTSYKCPGDGYTGSHFVFDCDIAVYIEDLFNNTINVKSYPNFIKETFPILIEDEDDESDSEPIYESCIKTCDHEWVTDTYFSAKVYKTCKKCGMKWEDYHEPEF